VTYTTSLDYAVKQIYSGEIWLRRWAQRLVLMNDSGAVVDAHCLREGEEIREMIEVHFPCHSARIRWRLDPYHLLMASMPRIGMIQSANWWLYKSPADAEDLKVNSEFQFQKSVGTGSSDEEVVGPAQPDKSVDKRDVEPAGTPQTLIHPVTRG
jgi:hypothetical protein